MISQRTKLLKSYNEFRSKKYSGSGDDKSKLIDSSKIQETAVPTSYKSSSSMATQKKRNNTKLNFGELIIKTEPEEVEEMDHSDPFLGVKKEPQTYNEGNARNSPQPPKAFCLSEEAMQFQFINLIRIHELLEAYSSTSNHVSKEVNPLLNHLRRRVLGILRFCYDAQKSSVLLSTLLDKDEIWTLKFSRGSVIAAIRDIEWASSSSLFTRCKTQIQLDLVDGPFAIFEEIQAVQAIAQIYALRGN